MISRIYVVPKRKDVRIIESYLIKHRFSSSQLEKIARALTNPIIEKFSIDTFPKTDIIRKDFTFAIEIGYLPGVTDNVAHTVKETITDLLRLKNNSSFEVYTSKIHLIENKITLKEAENIAFSLHNPLIERSYITNKASLPNKLPAVVLKKTTAVISVPLAVDDEELMKISKEGIVGTSGVRRGPLALDLASMKAIQAYFNKLKRDPNDIELEALAQTWSEHCKHTIFANPIDDIADGLYKTYIKGATNLIRKKKGKDDFCVSVFSDNSGGIIFDKDFLITHKVETHNSPSVLDSFGGAITGIVGVNRDTIGFGLGAKPVANTYGFCFSEPDDQRKLFKDSDLTQPMLSSKRIMDGVIKGINSGGNCSGIPTVSGFIKFDDRYRAKPMVFAGTIGLIPRKIGSKLSHEKKARVGDYIVMVGGKVGADGIHGATFSSVATDLHSPATAVQIGDPITQKKLSDAIVKEARDLNLYNSITDNGAGGFSSSVPEMARDMELQGGKRGGVLVHLEKVPIKYPGLRPWEIWISESQERMTLAVSPSKWKTLHALMESRGVEATVIGEFTDSGKAVVQWKGKTVMDIDMEFLHNGLPKQHLITTPITHTYPEPKILKNSSHTQTLENLLSVNNLSGFSFISQQYDHEVQASSVLKPLSGRGRINTDAQVFRPVLSSNKGVVLSSGIYPSYSDISTYHMAACAIDTAIRNAICAGGTLSHLALLDNFCWCSSNDPIRLAELKDAVKACYDYAVGYGTPFISGKDSMFNDFHGYDEKGNKTDISIPPTLLISAIGVMPNIYKTISPEFKNSGDVIYLLGETHDELGASEYYKMLGALGNNPAPEQARYGASVPKVNLQKNLKTYQVLEKAIQKELVASAMSVTSGGLGIALAKACVGGMVGCNVSLNGSKASVLSTDTKLFSESQGRILVSVSPKNIKQFEKICIGVFYVKLGKVAKSDKVIITDNKTKVVETNVKKLHDIYHKFSNSQK